MHGTKEQEETYLDARMEDWRQIVLCYAFEFGTYFILQDKVGTYAYLEGKAVSVLATWRAVTETSL